jgi:predicted PurR-regulated permease PerM
MHPLLTLFATYVGFTLFGLPGMILAPVLALLGKRLINLLTAGNKASFFAL